MISFSKAMKSIYGKSKTALPVNPEEVYIQSKLAGEFAGEKFAVRLFGRIYRQRDVSDKWVILLHPNQLNGQIIANKIGYIYYELGYNILAPDLRSFGKSKGHVAMGFLESMDIYDWLCKINDKYGAKHIVIHGLSLGGATINYLSGIDTFLAKEPIHVHTLCSPQELHVEKLIVDSSFVDLKQFAGNSYLTRYGTGLTKETFEYYGDASGSLCYSLVPMMIIHGTKDFFVKMSNADKIADCLNVPFQYWKVEGEGHVFVLLDRCTDEYREKVQAFLYIDPIPKIP